MGAVEKTIVKYNGRLSPSAILLNDQDYGFFESIVDPESLNFYVSSIDVIKNETSRGLMWYNISQMVKLGYLRLDDYVHLVL